jgi:thiamine-phosphate pyrophosphorylase
MIYALMDYDLLQQYDISFDRYINKCKELNAKIIQYRDKNSSINDVKNRLLKVRELWDKTLIINDYLELVEFCDGLHIGQEDLKKYKIEKKDINKILGLSTHNKEEILEANKMDLDYIGLGAYRPTTTKNVSSIGGEKLLELAKLSIHPVAIIGGVKLSDNLPTKYKVIGSDICKLISTQ